jgi:DNA-binding SARP family transcriptional activator
MTTGPAVRGHSSRRHVPYTDPNAGRILRPARAPDRESAQSADPPAGARFGILGPLEARENGRRLELGPLKQRIVLGLLLCQANQVVSVAALGEALWEDAPPRTAHKNLQVYVSTLRKNLGLAADETRAGHGALLRCPPGYQIRIGAGQLDALRFQDLARTGRLAMRGGHGAAAAELLGQAVRMWHGPVLPDLAATPAIAAEAERLSEQYLAVYEDWAEAKLAVGEHPDLVEDIDELVRRYPFRERLRQAQMLALYRSGRQVEALAGFDAMRQQLARELGLQPSPVLTRLYESILAGGRELDLAPRDPGVRATDRPGPAGPRPGPAGHRACLTRDLADFTGRSRDVSALLEVCGGPGPGRIAVISGSVGVGKTALAVHCAHRLGERFPGGRVLAGLRAPGGGPRPAAEVFDELLRGVGLTGALPDEPQGKATLLWESTAGNRALFVLDDAVTEPQVRSVLSMTGDSGVVITSRRHLGGLESAAHLALEPLGEAETVALLGRLIGAERVAAEPESARRLAAICCGLPLAVRIVGAKLAGLRHLTLAHYAERLADERRLLDELAVGGLQVRPRLAASYRDLEPQDRATLRCLAALDPTAFTAAETAQALGAGVAQAESAIERLIEAHLVEAQAEEVPAHSEPHEAHYALPSLFRAFVHEETTG